MAPPRRSTSARPPNRASAAPLPKGSRLPQPMLLYWIVRTIFIGSLVVFFASPTILPWAVAHQPLLADQQRGGLLTGLLLRERPTTANQARDEVGRSVDSDAERDT